VCLCVGVSPPPLPGSGSWTQASVYINQLYTPLIAIVLNFLQQKLYCPFSECIIDVTEQKTNFLRQVWGSLVTLKVVMLPHLLLPMLSADWMSNSTRVGRGRRVAKQLIVCCRDQKKNGRNRSINKATKNRQSSATAKRRAGAKGLTLLRCTLNLATPKVVIPDLVGSLTFLPGRIRINRSGSAFVFEYINNYLDNL
jgi:hypothetical protein